MSEDGYPEEIASLREAVRLSPDNVPLRKHLADTFLKHGYGAEAESEYRAALKVQPVRLPTSSNLQKSVRAK